MPRPPSPSLAEKEFVLVALSQSLRLDGRGMLDMREPSIVFGPELGWVECALGKTKVIAYVDAKMVKPTPERPYEGLLSIHSEISPMASSEYEPGRASDEEVLITRMLDKVLRRSDAVDKESLCILAGQRVWHLRLTIHFLSDAGNMLDCACLAGTIALRHFRRPEVEVIGEEVIVHPPESRAPHPLSMHHSPFCFTFAFYNPPPSSSPSASTLTILDPTRLEQTLCNGTLSLALNAQRQLCVLQKAGGVPLHPEEVMRLVGAAVARVKELDAVVERTLGEDWRGRKVEVR